MRKRDRKWYLFVCVRERKIEHVCVCIVKERDRERERERDGVCFGMNLTMGQRSMIGEGDWISFHSLLPFILFLSFRSTFSFVSTPSL